MRVVHQLSDARNALQSGITEFITATNSGCIAGIGYWEAVKKVLAEEFPKTAYTLWVCCGKNAAIAHDALRLKHHVICNVNTAMLAKLQDIAAQQGVKILDKSPA